MIPNRDENLQSVLPQTLIIEMPRNEREEPAARVHRYRRRWFIVAAHVFLQDLVEELQRHVHIVAPDACEHQRRIRGLARLQPLPPRLLDDAPRLDDVRVDLRGIPACRGGLRASGAATGIPRGPGLLLGRLGLGLRGLGGGRGVPRLGLGAQPQPRRALGLGRLRGRRLGLACPWRWPAGLPGFSLAHLLRWGRLGISGARFLALRVHGAREEGSGRQRHEDDRALLLRLGELAQARHEQVAKDAHGDKHSDNKCVVLALCTAHRWHPGPDVLHHRILENAEPLRNVIT
mmetsp:Transcript_59967/g.159512  ORF Transcript_59967/g.159512 Transcript_59967/m.159512 type:complete len:290 (-) Transcript_59967:56-925(-)